MEVYKSISAIIGEMAKEGIAKNKVNQQQRFNFRGIDDVYNALAPKLAEHQIMILPRVISRTSTKEQTKSGGTLFYVVCECEFDFVSSKDGSKHTVKTFGEAMDSGDKATNKAMSIALKYAVFQSFFIPTEVNADDPDATAHQLKSHPVLISEQQAKSLAELIQSKGFAVEAACKTWQIADLSEIETCNYQQIIAAVKSWGGK